MRVRLGIDETDSPRGGCTTYVAFKIASQFRDQLLSPPRLVRFNPNVPWKTRGNGGVAMEFEVEDVDEFRDSVIAIVEELRDPEEDTGVVLVGHDAQKKLREWYLNTLWNVVREPPLRIALKHRSRRSGRGLIGALAAIGFFGPHTYELLTYRLRERRGSKRVIDENSVREFELRTKHTFANVSPHPIITPHGRDPVLYGIRGTDPKELMEGLKIIRSEPFEGYALFVTNQATDAHMIRRKISELKPYTPAYVEGRVKGRPKHIGPHVYLELEDDSGSIEVFFYRQTGILRRIAERLEPGDIIGVLGGVRPPGEGWNITLNAEKLRVFKLVERKRLMNPRCPVCGARLKSAGRGKGRKCKRCGRRGEMPKEEIIEEPKITKGVYVGRPDAWRHLLRPPRVVPVSSPRRKNVDRKPRVIQ